MPYSVQFALAWINAACGVVCGVLTGAGLALHPSWLSGDVAATAGVIVLINGGLALILPPLQRNPGSRETKYLQAAAGVLPDDLAAKHPTIGTPASEALLEAIRPREPYSGPKEPNY